MLQCYIALGRKGMPGKLMNEPNMLECYITLGRKGIPGTIL
jgi:hypothetical protein